MTAHSYEDRLRRPAIWCQIQWCKQCQRELRIEGYRSEIDDLIESKGWRAVNGHWYCRDCA